MDAGSGPAARTSKGDGAARIGKDALREKIHELATISGDLELLTRQLSRPQSNMQVSLLRERMEQLTQTQRSLVLGITVHCPDEAMRARFDQLDRGLEAMRSDLQQTNDNAEVERIRQQIDGLVDEWGQAFQDMVVFTLKSLS